MGHKSDWSSQLMKNQNLSAFHAVSDQTKEEKIELKMKKNIGSNENVQCKKTWTRVKLLG